MAKAVNVRNASSGKAVVVKIEGGGGGGGDAIKTIAFEEAYTFNNVTNEATYTLTNAADVLDMLDDIFSADDPMEASLKYRVAFARWYEDEYAICWLAWPEYVHDEGNVDVSSVTGYDTDAGYTSSFVQKQLPDGVAEAFYMGRGLMISRSDIDPATGTLTKTGTPLG